MEASRCAGATPSNRRREQRDILRHLADGPHFVGDWHTHLEAIPTTSPDDAHSLADIVRRSQHELNGFVLMIVGTEPAPTSLSVSVFDKATSAILEPAPQTDDV